MDDLLKTNKELKVSFVAESELYKHEMEQSLDGLFHQTNYRRKATKQEGEQLSNITLIYEDTGARH